MHHHEAAGARGAGHDCLDVPWGDAAQVDEVDAHARGIQHSGRALGDGGGGPPRDQRHVVAAIAHRGVPGNDGAHRALCARGAGGVVEARLRVQDERGALAVERGLKRPRGIVCRAGHDHVEPGDVGERGLHRLRVERPKAGAIGAARGQYHHGRRPAAIGAPVHGGQLCGDLVERQRQEVCELHHRNGATPGERAADGRAHDGRLAERRVGDAPGELRGQPAGQPEHIALGVLDVLAHQRHAVVCRQAVAQHVAHGLEHGAGRSLRLGRGGAGARDDLGRHRRDRARGRGGVGRLEGPRRRGTHLGLDLAIEGHQVGGGHALGHQVLAKRRDGVAAPGGCALGLVAVHRLIIGIRVVGEALDLGNQHHGTPRVAYVLHRPGRDGLEGDRVAAVGAHDRRAEEGVHRPAHGVVERAARGVRGDRVAVVLDPEQHGQALAGGLADCLHHLTLLGGAIADAGHHDGRAGLAGDLARHTHRVQQPVARGHGHGQHVKLGVVQEGGHLPARRIGLPGRQQAVEEALGGDAPAHQKGARPVMRLQPVLWPQVVGQHGRGLVSCATELEEGLAALDELLLDRVDPARGHHGPEGIQRARAGGIGLLCGAQEIALRHRIPGSTACTAPGDCPENRPDPGCVPPVVLRRG